TTLLTSRSPGSARRTTPTTAARVPARPRWHCDDRLIVHGTSRWCLPSCRGGGAGAACLTRSALVAALQELVALRLADGRIEATLRRRRRRAGLRRQRLGLGAARLAPDPRQAQMVVHLPHAEHAVRDVLDYPLLDPRRNPARKRHHTAVHLDLDVLRVERGERNAVPHVVEDPLVRPAIPRRQIATHCRCRALVLVLQRRRH